MPRPNGILNGFVQNVRKSMFSFITQETPDLNISTKFLSFFELVIFSIEKKVLK